MKKPKKVLPDSQRLPSGGQSADKTKDIFIVMADDRGSFRRGDNYPHMIFLSTVLRWAVNGNYIGEEIDAIQQLKGNDDSASEQLDELERLKKSGNRVFEQIRSNNDSALASVGGLLADGIESESIAVFNTHSKLPIGRAENELLVSRLRTMDVKSNLSGLSGINDLDYSLDGKKLYQFIMANVAPTDDDLKKGGIWWHLAKDAPNEWHTHPAQAETTSASAVKDEAVPVATFAPKQQRQDSLAVQLDAILSEIPTQTPSKVMAKLRELIGKPNSCITANVGDGIQWERDNGTVEELNIAALTERIRNWKKKKTQAKPMPSQR